jgi:hypothetical protein
MMRTLVKGALFTSIFFLVSSQSVHAETVEGELASPYQVNRIVLIGKTVALDSTIFGNVSQVLKFANRSIPLTFAPNSVVLSESIVANDVNELYAALIRDYCSQGERFVGAKGRFTINNQFFDEAQLDALSPHSPQVDSVIAEYTKGGQSGRFHQSCGAK